MWPQYIKWYDCLRRVRVQRFDIPAIYSCRLEWIMKAQWEQEIYPKEEC